MNRRQFLSRIPMIGAALVAAPAVAAAMAVKPELAMGGTLAPGTPYLVGESVHGQWMSPDQVRKMEEPWENRWPGIVGIPAHKPYIMNFNRTALLRGDAQRS